MGQEGFSQRKETLSWTARLPVQATDAGAQPEVSDRHLPEGLEVAPESCSAGRGHVAPPGAHFFALELRLGDRAQRKRCRAPRARSLPARMLAAAPRARGTPALSRKAGHSGPRASAAAARGATCCPDGATAASGLGSRPLAWGAGEESEIPGELRGADLWGAGGEDEWGCKVKRPVRRAETPPTEEGTAEGTERARLRQRPAAGTPRQRRGAGPLPTASPGAGRQRRSGTGSSVRDGDHRIGTPRSLFAALSGGGRRPPLPRDGKPLPKAPLLGGPSDEAGPPPRPGRLLHPSLPGVGPPAPQLRHLVERRANSSESF